jgi:hypothetical protein
LLIAMKMRRSIYSIKHLEFPAGFGPRCRHFATPLHQGTNMTAQSTFPSPVVIKFPGVRRTLSALLIWAIALAPTAHAADPGLAPQATLYVTVPLQTEKAPRPEFGFRLAQEQAFAGDAGLALRRTPVLDFRLRPEGEASVLALNGVVMNANPKSGASNDRAFWILVGVAVAVAAIVIIDHHNDCSPSPIHPC